MLKNRFILSEINRFLDKPINLLIVGSRQVGKSFLLKLIQNQLIARHWAQPKQILSFDMESGNDLKLVANQTPEQFINSLYARAALRVGTPLFVFLDEIQYIPRASSFIKLLADHFPHIRLFLTGSSSLEIKRLFSDRLTGRKVTFNLSTLTFAEYLDFNEHPLAAVWSKINIFELMDGKINPLKKLTAFLPEILPIYEEFVLQGGYPAPSLKINLPVRDKLLAEIRDQYARRDVRDILNIENVPGFNLLLGLLAAQIGNLVNTQELAVSSRLNRQTVEKYLFLLSETFIIKLLTPYFRNTRQEIIKMPKVYFNDNGLRNILIESAIPRDLELRPDKDALTENAVWHELSAYGITTQFWRTKTQTEVDFILTLPDGTIVPLEVKYQLLNRAVVPSGLAAFIEK
ncbi:MAG: ATP-binding protein, partial [Candidatus Magasanikbacteria bacterium]|nr:ATP-binding protein [Candidatus Magasanikbacteria bacterium]